MNSASLQSALWESLTFQYGVSMAVSKPMWCSASWETWRCNITVDWRRVVTGTSTVFPRYWACGNLWRCIATCTVGICLCISKKYINNSVKERHLEALGRCCHCRCNTTARPPLDQDTDSNEPSQSSVLSGWLVFGVASQLGYRRSCRCTGPAVFCTSGSQAPVMHHNGHVHHLILDLHLAISTVFHIFCIVSI